MKSVTKKGFTLIETIVTTTLLAIIALGIGSFIITSLQAWVFMSGRESAVGRTRSAMNRMTAELRRIKKPQNILVSENSECQFIDLDVNIVDFKQSGTNLLRDNDILATGLASPEGLRFTYLDSTGEATSTDLNVRSIRVWLSLTSGTQTTTLESSARIRNL